ETPQTDQPLPAVLCRCKAAKGSMRLARAALAANRAWRQANRPALPALQVKPERPRMIVRRLGRTMKKSLLAIALAALSGFGSVQAQDYPTRPITMIVPFAAGGSFDVLGRVLTPRM